MIVIGQFVCLPPSPWEGSAINSPNDFSFEFFTILIRGCGKPREKCGRIGCCGLESVVQEGSNGDAHPVGEQTQSDQG
jgi:hypothetical protein